MTDQELKAVKLDLSTVHFILTRLEQGSCRTDRPALINECNRRAHFEEKLRNVLYAWDIKDQLVFYFSGHEDIRKNHLYCLKIGLKDSHWYPFNNLMNDVSAEEFQRAILVLDTWHNSAIIPGIKNSNDSISNIKESMENSKIPKVIAMITSSQKAQKSHELSYRSYSVFTDLFVILFKRVWMKMVQITGIFILNRFLNILIKIYRQINNTQILNLNNPQISI